MGSAAATTSTDQNSARVPELVRRGGDLERPERPVPFCKDLESFAGPRRAAAGLRLTAGMMFEGERYISRIADRHGPVFRNVMGREPVLMVGHPDHLQTMARNQDGAWSTGLAWRSFFLDLSHGGPLFYGGASHRETRRLLQPAFSPPAIAGYLQEAHEVYDASLRRWCDQGKVAFKAAGRRMFAEVSARIFMGLRDPADVERLDRGMQDSWRAVLTVLKGSRLSPNWRRAVRGMNELDTLLAQPRTGGTDLYARVLATPDEADWLDEDVRRGLFMGVMFGAFDTTSSGVTAMAYLLARHPQWQARVREEADGLDEDAPSPSALKGLEQLGWVWKEAMRMFPVAGMTPRVTLKQTQLGPHTIPAASLVLGLTGRVANDPHWWTSPRCFDPERFAPHRAEDRRHRALFLPFGAGAHACVGATLATAEVLGFFHALLRRCRIRLAREHEARHQYTPIGMLAGNVDLVFEPR